MYKLVADKKLDAGRDITFLQCKRRVISKVCFFDIVKHARENLIRDTYQLLISEDAELFDRVVRVD